MTTPLTTEERLSHLEGAYHFIEIMANNMVTREELQANVATLLAAVDGLKASDENIRRELRAAVEGLQSSNESSRAEMRTAVAGLQAAVEALRVSDESIRSEMRTANENLRMELRAEIRASFEQERAERRESEIRNTRWIVGAIFAAVTLGVAAIKLIP